MFGCSPDWDWNVSPKAAGRWPNASQCTGVARTTTHGLGAERLVNN